MELKRMKILTGSNITITYKSKVSPPIVKKKDTYCQIFLQYENEYKSYLSVYLVVVLLASKLFLF